MKDTGSICDQKFVWLDNPGQNIWNKIEKSSKTGQEKKSLISTFEGFLTAIAKVKFLEGRLGTRMYTYLNLKFFWYFLISLNPQILRCSATCIQLFFILDIKFRFTCDKSVCFTCDKILWPRLQHLNRYKKLPKRHVSETFDLENLV